MNMNWIFLFGSLLWAVSATTSGSGETDKFTQFRVRCAHPSQGQASTKTTETVKFIFSDPIGGIVTGSTYTVNGVSWPLSSSNVKISGNVLMISPPEGSWKSDPIQVTLLQDTLYSVNSNTEIAPLADRLLEFYLSGVMVDSEATSGVANMDCTDANAQEILLSSCDVLDFDKKFSTERATFEQKCGSFAFTFYVTELVGTAAAALTTALPAALSSPALNVVLTAGGFGSVVSTSIAAIGTTAALVSDVVVDNGEGPVGTAVEVSICFTTNDLQAVAIPAGGRLKVVYPFDWTLTDGLTMDLSVGGTTVLSGATTTSFSATDNVYEFDLTGLTTDVGPSQRVCLNLDGTSHTTIPTSCVNLNGWVWAVSAMDTSGEIYNFFAQNPPTDKCLSYRAIVFGDPHFNSFAGGSYDILGQPGRVYNIISDPHFQWNAAFVFPGNKAGQSYIGRCGFRVWGSTVIVAPIGDPIVNGRLMDPDSKAVLIEGQRWFVKTSTRHVLLRVPGYRIALTREDVAHHKPLPHFDMTVERVNGEAEKVTHGLLGQTVHHQRPAQPRPRANKKGLGVIEGDVEMYVVKSILGTDFRYNRFQSNQTLSVH